MKINLICDNKKSWYYDYIVMLKKEIEKITQDVIIIDDVKSIEEGSDISFFLSCEKIVKKDVMKRSKNNIVVHASDLPQWKWMSPLTRQILEWKNEIPITLFEMDEEIDNGDWYIKDDINLTWYELIGEIREKLWRKINNMIIKYIQNYPNISPTKQVWKQTIYKRRKKEDSKIDINKPIREQLNLLRVCDNERYPAYFEVDDHRYVLHVFKDTTS